MKFTNILAIAALLGAVEKVEAVEIQKAGTSGDWFVDKTPPPTAAGTPSSGFFGADEDDVMNNIFNHYAIPITNAAGQATGTKVLQKDGRQKACAEILLVTKQVSEAKMEAYMAARKHAPKSSSSPSKYLRPRW